MTEPTIGDLRNRVRLEAPVRVADGGGGADVSWALFAEPWADIRPVTGREPFAADRLEGRISHEIWLRHRGGVTSDMRFALGARVFAIRAVLDAGERHRWLRCLVEEKIP